MKAFLYSAVLSASFVMCSTSCDNSIDGKDNVNPEELKSEITFFINRPQFIVSNISDLPETRSDDYEAADNKDFFLNLVVFDKDNNKVFDISKEKTATTEKLDSIRCQLPLGKFKLVVMATKSDSPYVINSPTEVTIGENNRVRDTFYYCDPELEVKDGVDLVDTILLQRAVAQVTIKTNPDIEQVPLEVDKIRFSVLSGGSNVFNPMEGCGVAIAETDSVSYMFEDLRNGKDPDKRINLNNGILFFMPKDVQKVDVRVAVKDNVGKDIKTVTFNGVSAAKNKASIYSGPFFGLMTDLAFMVPKNMDFEDITFESDSVDGLSNE